ncbi:MAG: hypothetical protein ABUL71_04460, partial [Gemmatimonadota bacterium]
MIILGADVGGTSARVVLYDGDTERARAEGAGFAMRSGLGDKLATAIAELARPLLLRRRAVRADTLV